MVIFMQDLALVTDEMRTHLAAVRAEVTNLRDTVDVSRGVRVVAGRVTLPA